MMFDWLGRVPGSRGEFEMHAGWLQSSSLEKEKPGSLLGPKVKSKTVEI
jgi:hypothetical protein